MRFELLDGPDWRGDYATRRAAMADAELIAAKRGQIVRWARDDTRGTVGSPVPTNGSATFTIRARSARPSRFV